MSVKGTSQLFNLKNIAFAAQQLRHRLPSVVYSVTPRNDGLLIRTVSKSIRSAAIFVRHSTATQLFTLTDIAVVDRMKAPGRFAVNYLFLSAVTNQRVVIQLFATETSAIPSLAAPYTNGQRLFAAGGWLERECWDLFGIYFSEHGDLRRILTDYGFTGHPLRKDFPLTGFHELVYDDSRARVISVPVELSQEFRVFSVAPNYVNTKA